ncbi:MAG TPA: flagellar biosynthetic protein FliP [Planctomycetes bacterium]|nr:flagellar biosynthetic protein FliP [Planctomycetota bacterium]
MSGAWRQLLLALVLLLGVALPAAAQEGGAPTIEPPAPAPLSETIPGADKEQGEFVQVDDAAGGLPVSRKDVADSLKVVFVMTALSLLPALLVMATSFTRIVVVLGFLRVGLATPNLPPNNVLLGLALALTFLSMGPTLSEAYEVGVAPVVADEVPFTEGVSRAGQPMRKYLLRHTRKRALETFVELSQGPDSTPPSSADEVEFRVLLPAFVVSELTTAFEMGVVILIPFLVIDLVVASVLLAMNMFMLPPATVATPLKILLFVLIDGWQVLSRALVTSAV